MRTTKSSGEQVSATKKVVITLQDHDAIGKVYTKVNAQVARKDVLQDALKQVEEGKLYTDKECKQQLRGPYIEVHTGGRTPKRDDEFVFLIDMDSLKEHIVSIQIL